MIVPGITFILPTQNRTDYVGRAVASCLATERPEFFVCHVLVIVGQADKGTDEVLRARFGHDRRVEVIRQSPTDKGFMGACFLGVRRLQTEYATFMYDDDVVSPYLGDLYSRMIAEGRPFAMGFGENTAPNEVLNFCPLLEIETFDWWPLVLNYYRRRSPTKQRMPVSPICCLTTSAQLDRWADYVHSFCDSPGRKDLLLARNLGGDLMVFLTSLTNCPSGPEPLVARHVVAQFSNHPTSMSVTYDPLVFAAGYWTASNWTFEHFMRRGEQAKAAKLAGYIVVSGLLRFWRARRAGREDLATHLMSELRMVAKACGIVSCVMRGATAALDLLIWSVRRYLAHP